MNTVQKIAKNLGFLGAAQIIGSLVSLFLLIYLARYLGPEDYGRYSFALAFTAIFSILSGLGIDFYFIREAARNKKLLNFYFMNIIYIKFILSLVTVFCVYIVIILLDYSDEMSTLIIIFLLYSIINSFIQTSRSIFQSLEKMEFDAIITVINQVTLFILVLFTIESQLDLISIAYVYIISSFFSLIISAMLVKKEIGALSYIFNFNLAKKFLVESIPFGINSLFMILYFKIDTVMLSYIKNNEAVGIYNAAYNPLLAITAVISSIVMYALYPIMARYFDSSKNKLSILTDFSFKYITIIGIPLAIGCIALADRFIVLLYSDSYSSSILPFQVLALFIPFRLVNSINGTLIPAINKQNLRAIGFGISTFINISLNLILIPHYSYIGASVSTVISEIILYIIYKYIVAKNLGDFKEQRHFLRPLIASLVMVIFINIFCNINFFYLIICSIIVYFGTLISIAGLNQEDKIILNNILNRSGK